VGGGFEINQGLVSRSNEDMGLFKPTFIQF
jgi:hypothetical protein